MSNKLTPKKNTRKSNEFEGLTPEECGLEPISPVSELQTDLYVTVRRGLPKSLLAMLYLHLVESMGKLLINNKLFKGYRVIGLEPGGKPFDDLGGFLFKGILLTDSCGNTYSLDLEHTKVLDAENNDGLYTFDIGIITGDPEELIKFFKLTLVNPV